MTDGKDLSSLGIDSLQSARVPWETVKHANGEGGRIGLNFVFGNPKIDAIAIELVHVRVGGEETKSISSKQRMQEIIKANSAFI